MARNVNTTINPIIALNIHVIHTNGSFDTKVLKVGDMVENLRFVEKGTIQKISGRVADITYSIKKVKRFYTNISKVRSYFRYDVIPSNIIIDNSEVNHSHLTSIPVMELLEDDGVIDVERIETFFTYGLSAEILRSDNSTEKIDIMEGDIVTNLIYLYKGEESVIPSAKLLAIKRTDNTTTPAALELNVDGKLKEISVMNLVSVESTKTPVSNSTELTSLITEVEENGTVFIGEGTFEEKISFAKSVTISGAKAGVSAAKSTRDKVNFVGETVISGSLEFAAGANVTLDGLVLTKDALLSLSEANSVEVKNCIITKINPTAKRDHLLKTKVSSPMKINVSGCYFGAFNKNVINTDGTGAIYNLFELNCKLKDGSTISDNYFQKGSSNNNTVCIYEVEDGATINIERNIWEYSGNGVRIGTKDDPRCIININGNEYLSTDDGDWSGLVIIQPYNTKTTGMSKVTININKTKHNDKQHVYYLYAGNKDMQFTEDNAPVVKINGIAQAPLANLYH